MQQIHCVWHLMVFYFPSFGTRRSRNNLRSIFCGDFFLALSPSSFCQTCIKRSTCMRQSVNHFPRVNTSLTVFSVRGTLYNTPLCYSFQRDAETSPSKWVYIGAPSTRPRTTCRNTRSMWTRLVTFTVKLNLTRQTPDSFFLLILVWRRHL